MEESNLILNEIAKYLSKEEIAKLSGTSTIFADNVDTLDWFFWKTALEKEFDVQITSSNSHGTSLKEFNWKYIYGLFSGKDPELVALKHCYDWRIIELALLFGAKFNSIKESYNNYTLSDMLGKLEYKPYTLNYDNNIYFICIIDKNYQSLRWLLVNIPPKKTEMLYLQAWVFSMQDNGTINIFLETTEYEEIKAKEIILKNKLEQRKPPDGLELYIKTNPINDLASVKTMIVDSNAKYSHEFMKLIMENSGDLFRAAQIDLMLRNYKIKIEKLIGILAVDISYIDVFNNPKLSKWLKENEESMEYPIINHLLQMMPVV